MSESAPPHSRFFADLTDSQSVTATVIGLAVVVFVLVSLDSARLPVPATFSAEFLLSLSLMDVAFAYDEYWPIEYRPMHAVLWALIAGSLTVGVFVGVYALVGLQAGTTAASIGAFLVTVGLQFGVAVAYARTR